MDNFLSFLENHADILSLVCSFCMLLVTSIYAFFTWWHVRYSKKTLLESIKQNKEERQPYVVPTIKSISGTAFDASKYLRIQLFFKYKLENVGDSAAVTLYALLYAKMEYQSEHKLVYAHLMPNYEHSLKVGQKSENRLHFETNEFREIVEDLEICYVKNMKRIETDATVTPFRGPTIILRILYKNMAGQWFESVLEQELFEIKKLSKEEHKEIEKNRTELNLRLLGERVANSEIKDGDFYEGIMMPPSYSKLSRQMVDYNYVEQVLEDCRQHSDSKLEYLKS